MQGEESKCEVLFVAEAVGHTFKCFDFVARMPSTGPVDVGLS